MNKDNQNSGVILIVDDLPENIEILGTVLRKNHYRVAVAMNGEEAVSVARNLLPDLILLDISMPGMDGFTVCKILKDDPLTAEIPIIFLTAKVESYDIVTGFSLGAVDYITKPFKSPELLIRLKTHLTIKNLQDELKRANDELEKKVEERTKELRAALEKAEHSDKLKSEFLSQISHEIRTPLNAVISSASLIEMEMAEKADDDLKPLFSSIKYGSRRIIRTVDLILNIAQIHTNSHSLENKILDLNNILESVFNKYNTAAKDKNISIELNSSLNKAPIWGDLYAVTEIYEQLLDNAVNFTSEGSIKIKIVEQENNYITSIEDTGVGISEEFLPKLFTYFSQEEGGYTRTFEGNGLGLALAKKYCDLNDAVISVDSHKNIGSNFTVIFKKYFE